MQTQQQIRYYNADDFFVLQLEGEIRFNLAAMLTQVFNTFDGTLKQEIFDLTRVKLLDSTILGLFVQHVLSKSKFEKEKPIMVCGNEVQRFFNRIGVDQFFIFKKTDERLSSFSPELLKEIDQKTEKDLQDYVCAAHEVLKMINIQEKSFDLVVKTIDDKKTNK